MDALALRKFNRAVSVNTVGELSINAGKFSRAAIIMAFEMNGGVETFAEWADENPTEFYTKLFGKLIGREPEAPKDEAVEDLLDILDGDYEDVTPQASEETMDERPTSSSSSAERDPRMAAAAIAYAAGEPLD